MPQSEPERQIPHPEAGTMSIALRELGEYSQAVARHEECIQVRLSVSVGKPETRNNPKSETRNPKPKTRNPKPETRDLKNPNPETRKHFPSNADPKP